MDSAPKRLQIIEEEETLEQNQGFRRSSIKIMDDGSDKFFEDTSTNQGTTKYLPRLYIDQDSGIIKMGEQVLWSTWLGPLWIPVFFFLSDYVSFLFVMVFSTIYFFQLHAQIHRLSPSISWKSYVPLRSVSRLWGLIAECQNPLIAKPLVTWYANTFGCISEEAEFPLEEYPSLGEFFRRKLKPGIRPLEKDAVIVSPADGEITFQEVVSPLSDDEEVFLQQVKGVRYSFRFFLQGENGPLSSLMHPDKNVMYQSVIYLSPKDYHRFHSPVDWVVKKRRHVPGQLLSVNPESYWVSSLHSNERVVYLGEWEHGFFSLSAVGATNVGSIRCDFDPDLLTNERSFKRRRKPIPDEIHLNSINFIKGQEFGYFNFGSTIVLLFEAPKEKFDFRRISKNTTIRVGQRL
ncbi:phosphatidylserine decarboxylase proenzyme, mitochondrial isoform X1 [Lepeophtheirus salmonis]|uniref:phosphatidylserine decarboxylase proenzyme, mitochondrial isoform X1 n=2 Tax=Lepeophtheirus salmonis TaxID=72036 RepID=UPI001AE7D407|nr:phosphatidylserine decarboxylase proenzyme, mitochondrial-like isoform X1 [Lepeophtheirus salmonis]